MSVYDEPRIDCHNHIFDPARFPYASDTFYRPAGQEMGTAAYFLHVLDAYGVRHALVVGLLAKLADLGLFVQLQVEHDQLVPLIPMLERSGA